MLLKHCPHFLKDLIPVIWPRLTEGAVNDYHERQTITMLAAFDRGTLKQPKYTAVSPVGWSEMTLKMIIIPGSKTQVTKRRLLGRVSGKGTSHCVLDCSVSFGLAGGEVYFYPCAGGSSVGGMGSRPGKGVAGGERRQALARVHWRSGGTRFGTKRKARLQNGATLDLSLPYLQTTQALGGWALDAMSSLPQDRQEPFPSHRGVFRPHKRV
ncbi:hypothetical protein AOLI_G00016260 [Acnodon oligacanthus]